MNYSDDDFNLFINTFYKLMIEGFNLSLATVEFSDSREFSIPVSKFWRAIKILF